MIAHLAFLALFAQDTTFVRPGQVLSVTIPASARPGCYWLDAHGPARYVGPIAWRVAPLCVVVLTPDTVPPTSSVVVPQDSSPVVPVVWSSSWRTLGSSETAILDEGLWTRIGGAGLAVVPSTGLDFPTSNVLQVNALAGVSGFALVQKDGLPIPAIGQSLWYRWYFRATWPDNLSDAGSHPVQDANAASGTNWMFNVYHNVGGAGWYTPTFWPGNGIQVNRPGDQMNRWIGPRLPKHQTHRFELQVHRVGERTWQLHVRIYNSANQQIASDSAITNNDPTFSPGRMTLADLPTFTFRDVAALQGLNAGNNGISAPAPFPFVFAYQGGFAVSTVGWIGAYRVGEGR